MVIKIKEEVKYKTHSIRQNKCVRLTVCAAYSEITKSIELLQLLNNDVEAYVRFSDDKPLFIGIFRIKKVTFEDDGESILVFESVKEYVDLDNMNVMVGDSPFQLLMKSDVELE